LADGTDVPIPDRGPTAAPVTRSLRPLGAVAVGGTIGSLTRWGLVGSGWFGSAEATTVAINVVGSLLFGIVLGRRESLDPDLRLGLGTGFAGGLTTFSSYALAVAEHLDEGALLAAVGNGIGTPIAAVVGAGVGFRGARVVGARPRRHRRGRGRVSSTSARRASGGGDR
jgi:CrcB protein